MVICEICDKNFGTAAKLKQHKADIHDIDVVWHECDVGECEYKSKNKYKLKRHQANIHDIDVVWYHCGVKDCDYKCKDIHNLKKHEAQVHNINVVWHACDIDDCELKFKTTSDLKRHKSAVHEIGVQWFRCTLCEKKFKNKPNLERHVRSIHDIGTVWYYCNMEDCDYKAKAPSDLQIHQARVHDIGVIWHHCDLCDYASKSNSDLYRHKQNIHHINVKWHYCPEEDCKYKAKQASRLREHISYLHDIGDKECDFCTMPRYLLTTYKNKGVKSQVCRTCFRKATGRESRIEITMSKYLNEHFGTEFLLSSDTQVEGDVCQRYRPDKLYGGSGIVLHIECDEHQHIHSGSYSCDEKRISDIYDEFPGKKYVVIRWNPDKYKVPPGKKRIGTKNEKLELLLECMGEVVQNPPEEMIKIIYMFYDDDNKLLSRNIPHTLVYDEDDIQKIYD